jgi:hypothetical protein
VSLTTRDELKAEIVAWSKRSDLTTKLDDFIALAEQPILRELKLRVNEASVTGAATASIAIPAGVDRIVRLEVVDGNVRYALDYTSPGIEDTATGLPRSFTVQENAIRLIPAPSGAYTYTLHYIPNLSPLSDSNTSNWALANAPDVYLFGALEQLSHYTQHDEMAMKYRQMSQSAMDAVKRQDEARRFPVSGGLQIKPRNVR